MSKQRREELKKKQQTKKIISIVSIMLVAIIAVTGVIASCVHKCDDCDTIILGRGYYKENDGEGIVVSIFGSIFGDTESTNIEVLEDVIICKECAKNNASVKAELRNVSEFKR